jgi:hypothetical protein
MQSSSTKSGDLFYKGPDVEILRAPEIDSRYESSVKEILAEPEALPNLQHGDGSEESWKEEIEQGPPIHVV